ncbi:MAG: hypothetical protein COU69_04485 [Candidatus Pacebacteria bacterium CG10_big_fil_rev_8_21_14_0_10_56_10]|nr:MAG: hypothetical protein COU69_04485 [Candidatus Pacebacteria bacterium CG10_big_fil_rev_8_21_14_0_10_56_10]
MNPAAPADRSAKSKLAATQTSRSSQSSRTSRSSQPQPAVSTPDKKRDYHDTPFSKYFRILDEVDKGKRYTREFGSILILGLMEELGEMARAYLAEHGRKKTNIAAQTDETYTQELGDLMVTILRLARIKNINLDDCMVYSLKKIEQRRQQPKR